MKESRTVDGASAAAGSSGLGAVADDSAGDGSTSAAGRGSHRSEGGTGRHTRCVKQ